MSVAKFGEELSRVELLRRMRETGVDASFERADPTSLAELQSMIDARDARRRAMVASDVVVEEKKNSLEDKKPPLSRLELPSFAVKKTLKMTGILNSAEIQHKYLIDVKSAAIWRNNAKENPREVVADMQEFIKKKGFLNVSVFLDSMKGFETEAAYILKTDASELPSSTTMIRIDAPPKHGKSFVLNGPMDEDWEITVDYKNLPSAMHVWQLCDRFGPMHVADHYGADLSLLHIFVAARDGSPYVASVEPHANFYEGVSSFTECGLMPGDSVHARFASVIRPILVTGGVAASAISVGGGAWLVNAHVTSQISNAKFQGKSLSKSGFSTVFGQMNVMITHVTAPAIMYRSPVENERVRMVLCNATGPPLVSIPLSIRSRNGRYTVDVCDSSYRFDTMPGMSGAAYIAESDQSLIAIHEGFSPLHGNVVLPVQPALIMSAVQSVSAGSYGLLTSAAGAGKVWSPDIAKLKRKAEFRERLDAIFSRCVLNDDQAAWLTEVGTIVVSDAISEDSDDIASSVSKKGLSLISLASKRGVVASRLPLDGESAMFIGATAQGHAVSQPVAIHSIGGSRGYSADLPMHVDASSLKSFVVVAFEDANVLGWSSGLSSQNASGEGSTYIVPAMPLTEYLSSQESFSSESTDTTAFTNVYSKTQHIEPSILQIRDYLSKIFPYLSLHVYDTNFLEEAFTHRTRKEYTFSTAVFSANRYLARCGDAVLKERFMWHARLMDVPDEQSTIMKDAIQNNIAQSAVANELGLISFYRCGQVASPINEHASADLLEALTYVIYMHETSEVLDKFLAHTRMLPSKKENISNSL